MRHETCKPYLIHTLHCPQAVRPTDRVTDHSTQHNGIDVNMAFSSESNGTVITEGPMS